MSSSQVQETLALLEPLIRDLPPKMVITPGDPSYALHAEPYAIQKDLHPSVVFIPDSTTTLASIVSFLYKTKLDFNIRGHGFKSPSARDVIISMIGFNGFGYDSALKVATIGVGATWIEVAKYMEKVDPEYSSTLSLTLPTQDIGQLMLIVFSSCRCEDTCYWCWWCDSKRRLLLDVHRVWLHFRSHQLP